MDILQQYIEALVFASPQPITIEELHQAVNGYADGAIEQVAIRDAADAVKARYREDTSAVMEVVEIEGGLQFMTKATYAGLIGTHVKQQSKKKLSKSALETLSVIAYKQPVTKAELEFVRGVSCDYSLQKLLEKELVSIVGRADRVGKPLLYATSSKFMNHFGLERLEDLPQLSEMVPTTEELAALSDGALSSTTIEDLGRTTDQSSSEE